MRLMIGLIMVVIYFLFLVFARMKKLSFKTQIIVTILYLAFIFAMNIFLINKMIIFKSNPKLYCNTSSQTYSLEKVNEDSYFDIRDGKVLIKEQIARDIEENVMLPNKFCEIRESIDSPKVIITKYTLKNDFYRFLLGDIEPNHYDIKIPAIKQL